MLQTHKDNKEHLKKVRHAKCATQSRKNSLLQGEWDKQRESLSKSWWEVCASSTGWRRMQKLVAENHEFHKRQFLRKKNTERATSARIARLTYKDSKDFLKENWCKVQKWQSRKLSSQLLIFWSLLPENNQRDGKHWFKRLARGLCFKSINETMKQGHPKENKFPNPHPMLQQPTTETTTKTILWNAKASKTSKTLGESFMLQTKQERDNIWKRRDAKICSPKLMIHHWKYGSTSEAIEAQPQKIWPETCTSNIGTWHDLPNNRWYHQTYPNKHEIGTASP